MHKDADRYFAPGALVSVLTTQPVGRPFDYFAPEGGCHLGDFVEVPLGPRKEIGVVWDEGRGDFDHARIRPINHVLDLPSMRAELRMFIKRAADYTLTSLPAMLRLATRAPALGKAESMLKTYLRGPHTPARLTDARARVLDCLDDYQGRPLTLSELRDAAGVSPSVIKGLVDQDALRLQEVPKDRPFPPLRAAEGTKALTPDQTQASDLIKKQIATQQYHTTLLRGVTGSGKTEVYLEAATACLKQGRQVLVLLPEIALTAEFLTRVEERFGSRPAEWHSGVTMAERRRVWKMAAAGGLQMVVGARSALFLPFQDLGLIVVDEEHDPSYKQEEGVLYNARDMAVLRASIVGASVVLASATPSLESWANAVSGKYTRLDLTARFGAAVLPDIRTIDMRTENLPNNRWISDQLAGHVRQRLRNGDQSLLFLNRRGYAPVTICRACGNQIGCSHCDARLVEHRFQKRLVCHQCGETHAIPNVCPSCEVEDRLTAIGPGVERLSEEAIALFPEARVVTLSSDMYPSARALKAHIVDIANGGADIIVGTQLVAKGHNFPLLTLVGVIDTDLGLQGSDLRAAERTFQLMRQVSGRAGRAEKKGIAYLQTAQPEHPVIRAIVSGDEEAFWAAESDSRKIVGMPPHGRLVAVIISSPQMDEAFDFGTNIARQDGALRSVGAEVFGPAPAPIARVRGRHRVRLLIKADKAVSLQPVIRKWLRPFKRPSGLRVALDVDPQSFL